MNKQCSYSNTINNKISGLVVSQVANFRPTAHDLMFAHTCNVTMATGAICKQSEQVLFTHLMFAGQTLYTAYKDIFEVRPGAPTKSTLRLNNIQALCASTYYANNELIIYKKKKKKGLAKRSVIRLCFACMCVWISHALNLTHLASASL